MPSGANDLLFEFGHCVLEPFWYCNHFCTVFDDALPRLSFCVKIIHELAQSDKAHMFSPLVDCHSCLQIVVIIGHYGIFDESPSLVPIDEQPSQINHEACEIE